MRVISGSARGRRLHAPADRSVRPTGDRIKEALFSILYSMAGPLDGMKVLDLYAGSGALGIEALSRGGAHCLFVDSSRISCQLITRNIETTGFQASANVWCKPTLRALGELSAVGTVHDLILMDPPYGSADVSTTLQALSSGAAVGRNALVVVETSSIDEIACEYATLTLCDRRTYGSTALLFFRYHRPD